MTTHTIIVGVTGSIAAFKAADVVSHLARRGHEVVVVMTESAQKFVGPITFETLSHQKVVTSLFDLEYATFPRHTALADRAELLLVAPATANILAKFAHGIADDALSTLAISVRCPILAAPAMNPHMWRNRVVRANVARCKEFGIKFLDPVKGPLACGIVEEGRLAVPDDIVEAAEAELRRMRRARN
ncbi:MAG: phosphopantothenoylcysteine decarboxylase [Planctomycetes bacterium]|nr:phosphopantothenoylcysteine decarboxylase [Planctomycetota bacterium]